MKGQETKHASSEHTLLVSTSLCTT